MTRRDILSVAGALRTVALRRQGVRDLVTDRVELSAVVDALAEVFHAANPRFDLERFRSAVYEGVC